MRIIIIATFIVLLVSFPVFAYSDIGLLKSPKTIGLFILLPNNSSDISSGLVYNQKQNEKLAFEVSCINYYKIYPFMKNVIKLRADGKYKLFKFGPAAVTVLAGPTVYYASSVGAGLAADIGGMISINVSDYLAPSLTINTTIFKDGIGCDVEPMISFAPAFLKNTEIFCGVRLEASMAGFSFNEILKGKYNFYLDTGARIGF
jgi:hypothetical protein